MKFTLSWLRDHLDTEASLDEIVDRLTMIGLEVDGVVDRGRALAPFTVAHVIACEPHPSADRLKVCRVDTGTEQVQVVCGASNARAGMKGVFARPGTLIPGTGVELRRAEIRGVESAGMLCSERELELSEEHAGIIELADDAPVGIPFAQFAGLDDPVIDVALTPNRGDCAGVRGIARDLAAAGLGALQLAPGWGEPVKGSFRSGIGVRLELPDEVRDACPIFAGRLIRGVTNGPSPRWMQDRLRAVGLRPISALVDITNYISLDLARPLHVFDVAKLDGDVVVRLSRPGERLLALDGREYEAGEGMTMIADDAKALGFGGIMGGEESGCVEGTTDVFLESAWFDPVRTAATGRRLGIVSDARYRFERGVDPETVIPGMEAATAMILEFCGGEPSKPVIAGEVPAWRRTITFRPTRVASLGGADVETSEQRRIFQVLGFDMDDEDDAEAWRVQPPSWRPDVHGEADLVEEVVRIRGYDRIPAVPVERETTVPEIPLSPAQARVIRVRRQLAVRGLIESVTFSFMSRERALVFGGGDETLMLANPISADLDQMRPSIVPNLLDAAVRNTARAIEGAAVFEIGPEYRDTTPEGERTVAAGVRWGPTGPRHWDVKPRPVDVFDVKADALAAIAAAGGPAEGGQITRDAPSWYHPGRSGCIRLGKAVMADFGEIHPAILKEYDLSDAVVAFEVYLDAVPEPRARAGKGRPAAELSPFQPVERDFAFVVGEDVEAERIVRAARGADRTFVQTVNVFDVYAGANVEPGHKSVAIEVVFQPREATLTEAEIERLAAAVVQAVEKATGGRLRA